MLWWIKDLALHTLYLVEFRRQSSIRFASSTSCMMMLKTRPHLPASNILSAPCLLSAPGLSMSASSMSEKRCMNDVQLIASSEERDAEARQHISSDLESKPGFLFAREFERKVLNIIKIIVSCQTLPVVQKKSCITNLRGNHQTWNVRIHSQGENEPKPGGAKVGHE